MDWVLNAGLGDARVIQLTALEGSLKEDGSGEELIGKCWSGADPGWYASWPTMGWAPFGSAT